jgi:uncharacterized pyridoxal phosphate-containing UPF0001 family protein
MTNSIRRRVTVAGLPHEHRRGRRSASRRQLQRSGRDRSEIELLPVSKTVPQERIRLAAAAAGCHKLGENKVQEAHRKSEEMADLDIDWAVIGHLQSNKAKVRGEVRKPNSRPSTGIKVARALDRRLQGEGRSLDVYVQVNTSAEDSKFGMPPGGTARLPPGSCANSTRSRCRD